MADRNPDGKFAPGNKLSPGRKPRAREEKYYEITMSACTFADWAKIVGKAVEQAKRGDATARKWLSDYLVGVPETPLSGGVEIVVRYANKDD